MNNFLVAKLFMMSVYNYKDLHFCTKSMHYNTSNISVHRKILQNIFSTKNNAEFKLVHLQTIPIRNYLKHYQKKVYK